MTSSFDGEAFAGYRRLGAVSMECEVFQRGWYAKIVSPEPIDMQAIERVRIGERDFRVSFQGGAAGACRFKGSGTPPPLVL